MWSDSCDQFNTEEQNTKPKMLPTENDSEFSNREIMNGQDVNVKSNSQDNPQNKEGSFEGNNLPPNTEESSTQNSHLESNNAGVSESNSSLPTETECIDQSDGFINDPRNSLKIIQRDDAVSSIPEDCKPIGIFGLSNEDDTAANDIDNNSCAYKNQLSNESLLPSHSSSHSYYSILAPHSTPQASHSPHQARTPNSPLNNIPLQNSFLNNQMIGAQVNPQLVGSPQLLGTHQGHNFGGGHTNPYFNSSSSFSSDHWFWEQHRQNQQVSEILFSIINFAALKIYNYQYQVYDSKTKINAKNIFLYILI